MLLTAWLESVVYPGYLGERLVAAAVLPHGKSAHISWCTTWLLPAPN
jgi:hypothetical protein